jgi:hypothetical protein
VSTVNIPKGTAFVSSRHLAAVIFAIRLWMDMLVTASRAAVACVKYTRQEKIVLTLTLTVIHSRYWSSTKQLMKGVVICWLRKDQTY